MDRNDTAISGSPLPTSCSPLQLAIYGDHHGFGTAILSRIFQNNHRNTDNGNYARRLLSYLDQGYELWVTA